MKISQLQKLLKTWKFSILIITTTSLFIYHSDNKNDIHNHNGKKNYGSFADDGNEVNYKNNSGKSHGKEELLKIEFPWLKKPVYTTGKPGPDPWKRSYGQHSFRRLQGW